MQDNGMNAARGILGAIVLGVGIWGMVGLVVWAIVH
jgi:hypothetical protein